VYSFLIYFLGIFSLGSLGLTGSWKLTNYLQAQTALINKEAKNSVIVHFIGINIKVKNKM
jgi:hypothetical protein